MFGLSNKSRKPTKVYALCLCIHLVAFILTAVGMFTPNWSLITEQIKATLNTVDYDKGLIISCAANKCKANTDFASTSDVFFTAFALGVLAIILGFLDLQLLFAGLCIRSCKERNLGMPVAMVSILEGILLILTLIFFEISIGQDTTSGNIHREDTFGFSRGIIVGAIILYWASVFFITVEYLRRKDLPPRHDDKKRPLPNNVRRGPPPQNYRESYGPERAAPHRKQYPVVAAPVVAGPVVAAPVAAAAAVPPPYSKENPAYDPGPERRYSNNNGMKPCNMPDCVACNFVAESPTFWGPGGVFNIYERLTCEDSNVVYAIICMKDEKVFIGNSQAKLADTFRGHLASIKANDNSNPVSYHFTRDDHTIQDMRITALASLNCNKETRARLEKALSYDMGNPHRSYYGINNNFEFL